MHPGGLYEDPEPLIGILRGIVATTAGDENVDGKRFPVVDSCDILRPVVGG